MRSVVSAVLGCLIANSAFASTISSSWHNDTLVVRIDGDIQMGDDERFIAQAKFSNKVFVILNSNGGSILPAIAIGEYIHSLRFSTLVASNTTCASACAIIWLAGAKRYAGSSARVGFHAAFDANNGGQVTAVGNALVGAYMARIGLSDAAISYATQAAPNSIRWLSTEDAHKIGVDVQVIEDGIPAPSPPSAPSPEARLTGDQLTEAEITAAHRLSIDMVQRYTASGVAGLKASVDACYASVEKSGGQLAAEYCAAYHTASFMLDLGMSSLNGYPETDGLTIQDVRTRTAMIAGRVNMDPVLLRTKAARMATIARKDITSLAAKH